MTDKPNPLRLPPPVRTADTSLGERLAQLARASTPTPVRRAAWRVPLAAMIVVAGTGGLAYGAQSMVHHITGPATVVPGSDLTPRSASPRPPSSSSPSSASSSSSAGVTPSAAGLGPTAAASTHAAAPSHPAHPTHPAHPAHPTHPAHPSHPAHPTHSEAAHASRSAHPVHPTPTRRPTEPAIGAAATPDQHTTSGGHGG